MLNKRLCYISVATLPSKSAHAHYIVQFAEAFTNAEVPFQLIACANKKKSNNPQSFNEFYDTKCHLNVHLWKVWTYSSFTRIISMAIITLMSKLDSNCLYITHNPVVAAAFRIKGLHFIYDVHGVGKRERILNFATNSTCCKGIILNSIGSFKTLFPLLSRNDIPNTISPPAIKFHSLGSIKNLDKKEFRHELKVPENAKVFTYVGSLNKDRGIIKLLNAFKECQKVTKNIFLFIIGGTEQEVLDYTEYAKKKSINSSMFRFTGFISQRFLPKYYLISDYLLASYTSQVKTVQVMSPLKILEYLQYGLPIIAPDFARIQDWVKNNINGFLYKKDSEISLQETLIKALSCQQNIIKEIYNNNLLLASQHSWHIKTKNLIAWISELEHLNVKNS